MPLILGYAAINTELSNEGISPNRTVRQKNATIDKLIELAKHNIHATKQIIEWNTTHNILFYRMSSGILPHITNCQVNCVDRQQCQLAWQLVYDINILADDIQSLSNIRGAQRLTFHPDPFVVLNSPNDIVLSQCKRELYWHAKFFDIMNADLNSVMVLHCGGVYGNMEESKQRFIDRFMDLPDYIRDRIVIENDEYRFGLSDVIDIHNRIKQRGITVPIVLDWFHYECYTGNKYNGEHLDTILHSWQGRDIKMHLAEQYVGARKGSHSDYVENIPKLLFDIASQHNIYLMIEAKMKEQAVLYLKHKYNLL